MRNLCGVIAGALLIFVFTGGCAAPRVSSLALGSPAPPSSPGKVIEILPDQAYRILQTDPKATLLDVRTQAEFVFVGHPMGAYNVPLQFWDSRTYQWSENPDFDARVQARFPKDQVIIAMCRSGHRSRKAAERLVGLGYAKVYNMQESFEGETDPSTRLRTVNGWKNRDLPYTFDLDEKYLYLP